MEDFKQQQNYQYQEQQQQQQKREQHQQVEFRKQAPDFKICKNCGYQNEPSARFCEECGNNLDANPKCPNCNADVYEGADICESCGTWLLAGKCCFCYAEITDEDKFCPECGNPTTGIACPKCGTLNIFDFCKNCNTPLTEAAIAEIQKVNSNPFFQNLNKLGDEINAVVVDPLEEQQLQQQIIEAEKILQQEQQQADEAAKKEEKIQKMLRLEQFLNKNNVAERTTNPQPKSENKPIISEQHKKMLERAKQNMAGYEARKAAIQDKQREIQAELNKVAQITFTSGQEARRFFVATRPKLASAWECNYVHFIHTGPHECAHPELGGRWIITDEKNVVRW